ncbi:MAG: DUF4339 domain-containing protein [Thermoguttaceae bacterium]|jgi:hypothetical protein
MEFHYYADGKRLGPVNSAQLRELARTGVITPDTMIRKEDKKTRARNVKGLEFPPPVVPDLPPEPPVVGQESLPEFPVFEDDVPEIPTVDDVSVQSIDEAPAVKKAVFVPGSGARFIDASEDDPVSDSAPSRHVPSDEAKALIAASGWILFIGNSFLVLGGLASLVVLIGIMISEIYPGAGFAIIGGFIWMIIVGLVLRFLAAFGRCFALDK